MARNNVIVPEAKQAMDSFKMEVANSLNVNPVSYTHLNMRYKMMIRGLIRLPGFKIWFTI